MTLSFYVAYQAGVFSLGSIGFAAVGAYTTAVLTTAHGFGWVPGVICGTVVGAADGPRHRRHHRPAGRHLLRPGELRLRRRHRGDHRRARIHQGPAGHSQYSLDVRSEWHPLIVLVVSCAFLQLVIRSHYGRAFAAVRLDREMARGLGIPAANYRLVAFVFSGGFAALAGAIQAHQITVVSPTEFQFSAIILPLTFVMVGGVESWVGPVVAAILLDIFRNWARKAGTDWETLSYGIVLLIAIFLAPKGLTDPVLRHRVFSFARKLAGRPAPAWATEGAPAVAGSPPRSADRGGAGRRPSDREGPMSESATAVVPAEPLLRAEGLSRRFGGVLAIDDVSVPLWPSEILGLVGPNGAGKTTLVNLLTGHDRPNEGHVFWEGHETTRMAKEKVANFGVARTYQHLRLLEGRSVLENVLIGYHRRIDLHVWQIVSGRRRSEAEARAAARESLRRVGLEALEGRLVNSLSYGTRRKVEIARALVSEPTALVLDEPTAGMTASEAADIATTVSNLRDEGMGVLLIEHNVGLVTSLCDRIAVLEWGALIAEGTPAEVWANPQVRLAYLGES